MGWFRRKTEYYPQRERIPDPETYISLSNNKKVIRNLDEIISSRKRIDHWKDYPEEDPDKGFHDDQFISDLTPEDRIDLKHENLNRMLIGLITMTTIFTIGLAWLVNTTLGGLDGFLLSFIICGMIGGTILYGLFRRVKKEKESDREDLQKGSDNPKWVITMRDRYLLAEYDDGRTIWENAVYYDEIDRLELDGDRYLENHGTRHPTKPFWSKIALAPSPGYVKGAFYPVKTLRDQLVVLELNDTVLINGFEKPDNFRMFSLLPTREKKTDRLVLSIRRDDKARFKKMLEDRIRGYNNLDDALDRPEWE